MIRHPSTLILLCPSIALACTVLDAQDEPVDDDALEIADDTRALLDPERAESDDSAAPGTVLATKTRSFAGQTFTFMKVVGHDGAIKGLILDSEGSEVDESVVPRAQPSKISRDLQTAIAAGDSSRPVQVNVALIDAPEPDTAPREWGEAAIDRRGISRVAMNGVAATEVDIRAANEVKYARIAARRDRHADRCRAALRELGGFSPRVAEQPGMVEAQAHGRGSVSLSLKAGDVGVFLRRFDHLIAGIELASQPTDDLASGMLDTGIDPYALTDSSLGNGIGIYMSEGFCPGTSHITDYTRLNVNGFNPSLAHPENVSAIIRGTSPDSFVYCRSGYTLPIGTDLNGTNGNPRVYIETHSWGDTTGSHEYRINDRDFDNHVYNDAVAVFKSAGNLSADNPNCDVSSPGKALNLITIGNYDDGTDTISSSSCHVDSQIGNTKPEISAPGTSITAGGWTLSGTSMAAPHAAGFAADLMSDYSWLQLRPYHLKSEMLAGSAKPLSGGVAKVGVGGLDFFRTDYDGTSRWWEGDNASFSYFDSIDGEPNNGSIDYAVGMDANWSNVRVALTWLTRGSYTYDHRGDAHAIGMDLDVCVYYPYGFPLFGALAGCSSSWDNPYELMSFKPIVSGTYHIRVNRYSNGDTSSKLHMSVAVDW